jgi:hypothetical protein
VSGWQSTSCNVSLRLMYSWWCMRAPHSNHSRVTPLATAATSLPQVAHPALKFKFGTYTVHPLQSPHQV